MMRNLIQYRKQAYTKKALFVYLGTAALKKGHGMCFDLDYYTSETGEAVTDPFGARGMKVVERPSKTNNGAFAGVLTQNYPARSSGMQMVELALPGGCAMVAQRVTSTINAGLITCAVGVDDDDDVTEMSGVFGFGGFPGRGSAIPLETLSVADEGDIPLEEITGVCTSVYSSSTGLTTFTCTTGTPGTYMGYASAAVDASDWEVTVWGGATAADSTTERVPSGVYPVVQATGATTFTVTGDVGDGACTISITKKNLLKLAYLQDGPESGLCDYYIPYSGNSSTYTPMTTGMSIVLGGLTLASDDQSDVADGTIAGQRKGFYMLGSLTTKEMLWDITSSMDMEEGVLSTIEMNTAGEWATMEWIQMGSAATKTAANTGTWQLTGISDTGVAVA
jgi:hypothetical protein